MAARRLGKRGVAAAISTTNSASAMRWSAPDPDINWLGGGLQGAADGSWFAMAGPAGLSKPMLDRLNAEVRKAVALPDVSARLASLGGEPAAGSSAEMHDRVARELQMWSATVDKAGIPKQ